MTIYDLRIDYKRDTGLDANDNMIREVELDGDLTVSELGLPIDVKVYLDADNVPYIEWLEEQLIKLQK